MSTQQDEAKVTYLDEKSQPTSITNASHVKLEFSDGRVAVSDVQKGYAGPLNFGGPGSGPHPGTGSHSRSDDGSKTPSKEAQDLAKNSSNKALAKVALHKIGDDDSQLAARQELASRGVSIEQADKLAGPKNPEGAIRAEAARRSISDALSGRK